MEEFIDASISSLNDVKGELAKLGDIRTRQAQAESKLNAATEELSKVQAKHRAAHEQHKANFDAIAKETLDKQRELTGLNAKIADLTEKKKTLEIEVAELTQRHEGIEASLVNLRTRHFG